MISILIIEDDVNIAKMIKATLSIVGYSGTCRYDGRSGAEEAMKGSYDLILLDIMLPEMNGFEVMESIKSCGTPVIFLTAMQDVADKVKGLRLGAEDYIVKPFEALELLARIDVVLRRSEKTRDTITYGDLTADIGRHIITLKGQPVQLTPKEFDVIVYFLQHQDIAVTRERLLSAVWGYEFEGESRTVDIHVQQVRRKLGLKDKLITIPKLGYRLESQDSV
ncbi:MAG: response regulator transcription factor [Ruminococcus sp.]|nr:response regulator transcription factor [Ruminococcus sp.]MBP8594369.1 response regulator transcription factor [Ruminococcus sp.]MBQ3855880.1 response regulator transcription factor [Ruminococcus sp.]MBQ8124001.1 response regulator transcription factor [Ruminococcus sp.]HBB19965.1 DNA-binding response regulator [Ruminococcus sp.]